MGFGKNCLDTCLTNLLQQFFGSNLLMVIFHGQRLTTAVDIGILYAVNGKHLLDSLGCSLLCRNEEISIGSSSATAIVHRGIACLGHNGTDLIQRGEISIEPDNGTIVFKFEVNLINPCHLLKAGANSVGALLAVHVINTQQSLLRCS